jgi:hypothetical protein
VGVGNCVGPAEAAAPTPDWLDIDRSVEAHCRALGIARPSEPAELMELHVRALSAWSSQLNEETAS